VKEGAHKIRCSQENRKLFHMRLAYFTPLPPSKSGIADYNAELLPYLARGAEIAVFVQGDDEFIENRNREDYVVYQATSFDEIHLRDPFDLCIYHQGNNPHHEYIFERALVTPGLLVLHEHCLHHLIAGMTLARGDEEGYWNELFYAYGRRGSRLAEIRAGGVGSEYQQFLFPLNRRLAEGSLGVIVHNAYSFEQLEGVREGCPVEIIPHHLSPKTYELDAMDKAECRRLLGIPEDAWVIASLGFVTQSKRIPVVLAAFKQLLTDMPKSFYLIVGEDHPIWAVAPLIEEMGLGEKVRLTGYATERDFFRYLKAVDVIVNLRFPTAGETSGTLIRSLGAGKPVIVTDFGQFGEFPDDCCLKVRAGPTEERDLYTQLRALAYRPTLREGLSRRASEWVRRECDINRSAARYLAIAERIIEREKTWRKGPASSAIRHQFEFNEAPTIKLDREEAFNYLAGFFADDPKAIAYLQKHAKLIIETVELVPVGEQGQRLLELGSYKQMALLVERYGDYGEIAVTGWAPGEPRDRMMSIRHPVSGEEFQFQEKNVDLEHDRFPFPDSYFDVALCCELIEHLREDPMHMLIELNRILKWGGLLILTTPNIASAHSIREAISGSSPYICGVHHIEKPAERHMREYTFKDVSIALESSGFKVVNLFTSDIWYQVDEEFMRQLDYSGVPRKLRSDTIFAVGRKQSLQFERYPEELYD
jgi:glycosyltransferase involved in cell wall biosynthesis/SAM-dependent methyltransferase